MPFLYMGPNFAAIESTRQRALMGSTAAQPDEFGKIHFACHERSIS